MIAELLGQVLNIDHIRALSFSLGRADASKRHPVAFLPADPKQVSGMEKRTAVSPGFICGGLEKAAFEIWEKIILVPFMSSPFQETERCGESDLPVGACSLLPE
jgi:hypothetical protein